MKNEPITWSWDDPFEPALGLWKQRFSGHTRPIASLGRAHSGPNAASRLVIAAQLGAWNDFPVKEVLRGLDRLQWRGEGDRYGCFRWYAEESEPVDTNAAFFIGLNLIVLAACYRERLDAESAALVERMLDALDVWFSGEAATLRFYYPNKFLGDLVCGWLVKELLGRSERTDELGATMAEAAGYWLNNRWSWGEHLSDPYATILLDELSALLLLAKQLPDPLRHACRGLLADLLAIDDAFAGGPRVPALRNYAFNEPIGHVPYRESIRSWLTREEAVVNPQQLPHMLKFGFGRIFHELGWHELAPPAQPPSDRLTVPCYGGARAAAWLGSDMRLGSISRFPLVPNSDHPAWGLSWQSFPIAFSRGGSDWGFWRWHAREDGIPRSHPARDKHAAYLNNALSAVAVPVPVGETFCRQEGPRLVAVRRMSRLSRRWDELADALTITAFTGEIIDEHRGGDGTSRLIIAFGPTIITVFFHPLGSGSEPVLSLHGRSLEWRVSWSPESLARIERVALLWLLEVSNRAAPAPAVEPSGRAELIPRAANEFPCALAWAGWQRLIIDPLAGDPLIDEPAP